MEKIMSKSNDTTKTRELTEAELAAVSGGLLDAAMAGAIAGAAKGAGPHRRNSGIRARTGA
jgi:lactobin A/cerein 7B family class IIb bacteriocin